MKFLKVITVMCIGAFLLGFLGKLFYMFDLLSHFRVYYSLSFLLLGITFFLLKNKIWGSVNLIFAAFILTSLTRFYISNDISESLNNSSTIKVASFNLLSSNTDYGVLRKRIKENDIDIVIVLELDSKWERELNKLKDIYPFQYMMAKDDNFGIGLLSKNKIESVDFVMSEELKLPMIVADKYLGNDTIRIVGVHTTPAMSKSYFSYRNNHFKEINQWLKKQKTPLVLLGDLNCTSFSPSFEYLKEGTNLKNAREGFGIYGSWNTKIPLLSIPIDHCLVSERIGVSDFYTSEDYSSDHLGIICQIGLKKQLK